MPCRAADSDISIAEQIKAMRETYYQLTHTIIEEIEQPKYVCTKRFCMYGYPIVLCEYPQLAVLYGYPGVLSHTSVGEIERPAVGDAPHGHSLDSSALRSLLWVGCGRSGF
jgi:hypothetical protein